MRRFVSLTVGAAVAVSLAVLPAVPAAAAVTAKPFVVGKSLNLALTSRMVTAGGHLYMTPGGAGNNIVEYSLTGNKLKTLTNEPGADGMAVSADGTKLYVALSSSLSTGQISVINARKGVEIKRLDVDACPKYVALTTARVFYSYGCSSGTPGVASVDLTGANPAESGIPLSAVPLVAATSDHVVVGVAGAPDTVTSYDASTGDGTLSTPHSESSTSGLSDLALTASGDRVLVAGNGQSAVKAFSFPSMASAGVSYNGVPSTQAVATSPDGTKVATGFSASGDTVNLYGNGGSVLWKRYASTTITPTGGWYKSAATVLPGGMTFSPQGGLVYALVRIGNDVSMFVSVLSPKASSVKVSAPDLAYKGSGSAVAKVSGGNKLAVQFFREPSLGTAKSLGIDVTNSSDIAKQSFSSPYSGKIRAIVLGNAAVLPSMATDKFTVGSKSSIKMSGYYKKANGIVHYRSYSDVQGVMKVLSPVAGRTITAMLWAKENGKWVKIQQGTVGTDANGNASFYLTSGSSGLLLRQTMKFAGDQYNRGSHATGVTFVID